MKEYDGVAFETMHCRMFVQSLFLAGNNKSEHFLRRNPFYRHNQLGQQPGKYFYLGIENMFNKMFETLILTLAGAYSKLTNFLARILVDGFLLVFINYI